MDVASAVVGVGGDETTIQLNLIQGKYLLYFFLFFFFFILVAVVTIVFVLFGVSLVLIG